MKWILIAAVPSLIIWVFAAPIFTLRVLIKNRNRLDDENVKAYYLFLYQGLSYKVYYWEFINTIRKVLIIGINTILSMFSISYRILLCILAIFIIERLQERLKPFKFKENNEIEFKAIIAGTSIILLGLVFEQSVEDKYYMFEAIGLIFIIIYNFIFILKWIYLFLSSLNIKNETFRKGLTMFGYLICSRLTKKVEK